MEQVVLGLSGGVDSAVAAGLLMARGYQVQGLFLDIGLGGAEDAARVAEKLKIPFHIQDISQDLQEKVCDPFVKGYLCGKTPNPCVLCNPSVKFPALTQMADRLGAAYVATGHYARTRIDSVTGRAQLLKGQSANDQSYMLCRLPQAILQRLLLPLGELDKAAVRSLAREMGLAVADKPDSMEICFIPDGDYAAYIERQVGALPAGDFVSAEGTVLGRHRGIHHYTVGQRRGLGISLGQRAFVSEIRPETNQVVITLGEDLWQDRVLLEDVNWVSCPEPAAAIEAAVRIRHSRRTDEALVTPRPGRRAELQFKSPVRAPTPGQAAVFYDGDLLLGGGTIIPEQKG